MTEKVCGHCRYCYKGIFTFICNIQSSVYINFYDNACDDFEPRGVMM